jgi:hypothetical protein
MKNDAVAVENKPAVPQKVKQNYHMIQQFHSWAHTQKNGKQTSTQQMSFVTLFIMAKRWKQPKCPLTDKWINTVCPYSRILFSHEKNEVLTRAII